jgi:hypothetical protein
VNVLSIMGSAWRHVVQNVGADHRHGRSNIYDRPMDFHYFIMDEYHKITGESMAFVWEIVRPYMCEADRANKCVVHNKDTEKPMIDIDNWRTQSQLLSGNPLEGPSKTSNPIGFQ